MADRIELIGLQGYGYHGVFEQEKREGQDFLVDIVLWTDFSVTAASDNLADTVSYADLAEMAMEVITGPARDLIETVASEIADRIPLSESVHAVEVTVHKPQAPVGHSFQDVRVVARRSRRGERLRVAKGKTGND